MKKIIFIHTKESIGNVLAYNLHSLHRMKHLPKYNSFKSHLLREYPNVKTIVLK